MDRPPEPPLPPEASPPPPPAGAAGGVRRNSRLDGLALLIALALVWVFASSTLPALLDKRELLRRRAQLQQEVHRLEREVHLLGDLREGVLVDPLLAERLAESRRLSPQAGGFRVISDPQAPEVDESEPAPPR